MGQPLFTFEDDFISSMCGMSDAEVRETWTNAFEDGRRAMEMSVQERARQSPAMKVHADDLTVKIEDGSFVVVIPADIEDDVMAMELGTDGRAPQPVLRGGVVHGAGAAAKAISDALELS